MPREFTQLIVLCALLCLYRPGMLCADEPEMLVTPVCLSDGFCLQAEIADTAERREVGLMFRGQLGADRAMLFVFPEDGMHRFWMKNMAMPIDIVWLSAQKSVLFIAESVPPCAADAACPVYSSPQPCRYVLELAAGTCRSRGLSVGDTLTFEQ